MAARHDDFLNLLLWAAERLARPSLRNLTDSFESWAFRRGLLGRVARLEKAQLLERSPDPTDDRLYRLSAAGRLLVLGGRDPEELWQRRWDGNWRMVLFDVPVDRNLQRDQLRRCLQGRGFGFLQGSVWITPHGVDEERQMLRGGKINVESLILLDARPCAGESDAEIVAGAWDFDEINCAHSRHMKILAERPRGPLTSEVTARELLWWAGVEAAAWRESARLDPFLPARILPQGYLGRDAWDRRIEVLAEAREQLSTFDPKADWAR